MSRGVPIKKAMDGNNLIVFAMNGQPLSNIHGGPVRLVIPGWPGSVSAKWFTRLWVRDKYHDGPGMGATSYRVAIKPMVPGDKPADGNFRDLELMPVRSIITSPANGAKLAAGTKEVKLRGAAWAGDLTVRQVDVSTDFGATWTRAKLEQAEEQIRLAALDRERQAAVGRLFRNLDARHQLQGRDAAAHRRRLESAGLWRQSDAPGRGAGRLMRKIVTAASLALAVPLLCWSFLDGAFAQAPQFAPRDENPEDFPAGPGRDDTFYACTACHSFKLVAQQGMTRRQWEDSLQWMTDRHGMSPLPAKEQKIVLDYLEADLPAARAGGPRRLAEPVRAALSRRQHGLSHFVGRWLPAPSGGC